MNKKIVEKGEQRGGKEGIRNVKNRKKMRASTCSP
jgi:hypothetical protein